MSRNYYLNVTVKVIFTLQLPHWCRIILDLEVLVFQAALFVCSINCIVTYSLCDAHKSGMPSVSAKRTG